MKFRHITSLVAVLGLALFTTTFSHAATIVSTFDTDAEGWTANPGEGTLAYVAAGGNPGGHIRITDIGVGSIPFGSGAFAGPAFLGDLSSFDEGTLSLDMATFAGGGVTFPSFGEIQLSGGGDIATFDIAASAPSGFGIWETFSAPLLAASWGKSQTDWLAILANVTSIGIPTDAFDGADTIGIDNFAITSKSVAPVPLPAAFWLFASGLLWLRIASKRQSA